ncbi:MAP7 domain-containing protein 1 [Megalops cyprinoides]|uniref:MAP7 domain-containing protein 1 n=1 Tax=Megalops cyprinoides TaxID=118141 RepID=UPI001864AA96|nr:MAP7 domain-containing protein 1 [Megalops cyprinoides]
MSSWVRLLAVLALCLRFASAEGDPLPLSMVELVRSSPISSIEDLQRLLVTDSVDEEPDSQGAKHLHSNSTFKRLPRSLGVEPAQQALCKVRTEVLEVTRDMLDRRNANFMLWPPCVEVQRCSGCCNTRARQCVPTVTSTRYLQVMKIQYINKRPHYEKAVISVQDHVECRCESVASPVAPVTRAKKPQHTQQPQRQTPKPPLVKVQSKEELHRHDELKHNQKPQPDGQETVWHPKHAHTQTPARQTPTRQTPARQTPTRQTPARQTPPRQTPPSHSVTSTERTQTEQTPLQDPQLQDSSRQRGGEEKEPPPTQEAHRPHKDKEENAVSSAKTPLAGETHMRDGTRQETRHHNTTAHRTAAEGEPGTHSTRKEDHPQRGDVPHRQTEQRHPHNHSRLHNQTEVADRGQHTVQQRKDSERLEAEERHLLLIQQEKLKLQEEKRELLLLQRKLDQEMQQLRQQQQQHHQYSQERHHHHSHQTQTLTTTHRPVTTAPTTTRPSATPQTQRTSTRPAPSRRRPRKNRKRMSKATMRAILM